MQKRTKNLTRFTLLICLILIAGIFVYYRYMNREKKTESESIPATEVEKLISKDLDEGYPETAKEVLNLYLRYVQCIYNSNPEDEQMQSLMGQLRKLYHSELLAANQNDAQFKKMQAELKKFAEDKIKIATCTVDSSVKKKTIKGKECALLQVAFLLSNSDGYTKSYQKFVLAIENERWKILGFQKISDTAIQAELTETEE